MIKVAVIGLGNMGQHHVRVYQELECQLVAVADTDVQKAKTIGEQYGVPYCAEYKELIPYVDAVTIAVPTTLHSSIALDFLSRGVHCLVEKPIASCLEDAEEMRRVAGRTKAKLAIGHIERFNPAVTRLKSIIDQGVLGELMIISIRRVGPFACQVRDVGIIVDTASHDIDIARYLVGREPIGTYTRSGRLIHRDQEDHAVIVLDFGSTTASIEVNWLTPHKVRSLVATGSKGIAYLDYIAQTLAVHNSRHAWSVPVQKTEPLKLELKHFLRCAKNGQEPLVDGYEGLRTLELCLEAAKRPGLHRQNARSRVADRSNEVANVSR